MKTLMPHLRGLFIAIVALALSAGLAFAAKPASTGPANAASHHVTTVPVAGVDEQAGGDEGTDETVDETPDPAEATDTAGDNCLTDPTGLTPEELAALTHGSIVCWAAHQVTPDGFANHGAWVKSWAQSGKSGAAAAAGKTHGKSSEHSQKP